MAAKNADPLSNPLSVEMGAQSWANTCGVCHVGGGQLEYNRDLQPYGSNGEGPGDTYVLKYARPDDLNTVLDETSWKNVTIGNMDATNKAEMDCLMCHLNGSNAGSAWLKTLDCGPSNPIGPMTDPTCSGTPMFPGTRTVGAPDAWEYDMFNRNFGLKQRRMDLIASMGAGAKGTFDANGQLTGIEWDAEKISLANPAQSSLIGTCVTGTVRDGIEGCPDYTRNAVACQTVDNGDGTFSYEVDPATSENKNYLINGINDCLKITEANLATTPLSENCSVCHARDDNTMGLPGMITMKTGFGNYGLIMDPSNPMPSGNMGASSDLNTDNGPGAVNDDYWFDFGCKTGMGKRAHKVGTTGDYVGPNARYGMSMFLPSTLDMDPGTVPNAGDPIPGKMPDIDVHDAAGMQCADCHYAIGSETATGYIDIPAQTTQGYAYPAERVYGMDHQFAQPQSSPDVKGKNNLDLKVGCVKCHFDHDHPRLAENGGTLVAPTPLHNGLPQLHLDKIACVTCHVPETYSAPGRLKYRDWTAGFARGTFRNTLDWNYDLITGSHKTVPQIRKWADKGFGMKIYPFLPSLLPTWYEMVPNSGVLVKDDAGMVAAGEPEDNIMDAHTASFPSPVKNRDVQVVAEYVRDNNPQFDMRLNGGNSVPLFDGFQIVDSWEIDTTEEIDAMLAGFTAKAGGSDARFVSFLNVVEADFDVTHGIVPKGWALGGSARGGCVSCHSSMVPTLADMQTPNPNYSPYSIGFFEGYIQPVANAGLPGFGVGAYEMVKNWMAMFADFDAAAMCGAGDPTKMADDSLGGMANPNTDHHNFYFNPMTGQPNMTAECASWSWFSNNPMFGTTGANAQLQHVIGMMTTTFDQAMGFPAGTAMQMGMYDGVAGIQGFALKELQTAGTLGCNPFAGPISFSPMASQSVNNCMPNYADAGVAAAIDGMMGAGSAAAYAGMINGTCVGADPINGVPGACSGGFRNNGACMADADCEGAMTDMAEIGHNPMGLMLGRAEAVSHFKIDLQQSYKADGTPKVKWGASGGQNPSNPGHVASWDQAAYCYDYMGGANPMQPAVVPCNSPAATAMDGKAHIATAMSANQFLGYTPQTLALLMNPGTAQSQAALKVTAQLSAVSSLDTDLVVSLNASRSTCAALVDGVYVDYAPGCNYSIDPGATVVPLGSTMAGDPLALVYPAGTEELVMYPAEGTYDASVTVCMNDNPATLGNESQICDTASVTASAQIVEAPVPTADFATAVVGNTVTLTAPTLDASVVRVYIYWGDRKRTVVTNMADLAAGIDHIYSRGGRSYNIIVEVIDSAHNKTRSTDPDLTVALP